MEAQQATKARKPLRILRQIVKVNPNGGGPLFDPTWAEGRAHYLGGKGERIERQPTETAGAFESRAREVFHDCSYFIG